MTEGAGAQAREDSHSTSGGGAGGGGRAIPIDRSIGSEHPRLASAEDVVAYVTHGVLSGGATARVEASALTELVITDSIGADEASAATGHIRRLTIAPLLAEAIKRIADESSVSSLFD